MEIRRVHDANMFVYGAAKTWARLNDEDIEVARCCVERLMREMALVDDRRDKTWTLTTDSDHDFRRPAEVQTAEPSSPEANSTTRKSAGTTRTGG